MSLERSTSNAKNTLTWSVGNDKKRLTVPVANMNHLQTDTNAVAEVSSDEDSKQADFKEEKLGNFGQNRGRACSTSSHGLMHSPSRARSRASSRGSAASNRSRRMSIGIDQHMTNENPSAAGDVDGTPFAGRETKANRKV